MASLVQASGGKVRRFRCVRRRAGDPTSWCRLEPFVHDRDPKSGYRAFEACALMSLRRSLRRGSVWVDHSMVFRDRKALLFSDDEWTAKLDRHLQILGHPSDPREFIGPVLAAVSAGLSALAEAVQRGRVEISDDRLLHIPPLSALLDDIEPCKTREAVFQRIGDVQLPDILMEVDAATHFSEALLARRADSTDELLGSAGTATYAEALFRQIVPSCVRLPLRVDWTPNGIEAPLHNRSTDFMHGRQANRGGTGPASA